MQLKALWKDTFREIPKSIMRFLAILVIIFLGVGFFVGISATSPDMIATVNQYFSENNLMDFKIQSTYGLTAADLEDMETLEDTTVQGHYAYDFLVEDYSETIRLYSYDLEAGQDINQYQLVAGRLPEAPGEITIDANEFYLDGLAIGDIIRLETGSENGEPENYLDRQAFEVVGFVNTPLYITNASRGNTTVGNGTLEGFGVIAEADYDTDIYTEAHLRVRGADGFTVFSDKYENYIDGYEEDLKNKLHQIAERRTDTIQEEAEAEIADGWAKIATAEKELADAEAELEEGQNELYEGWAELANGKAELAREITNAHAEIDRNEAELDQAIVDFEKQRQELINQRAELQGQLADLAGSADELNAGQTQIQQGISQIETGLAEIEANKPAIETGLEELKQQEIQLEAARAELVTVRDQLAELKQTIAGLDEQIAGLESQLEEAPPAEQAMIEAQLETLKGYQATAVAGRTQIEEGLSAQNIEPNQLDAQISQLDAGLGEISLTRSKLNTILEQEQELRSQRSSLQTQLNELNVQEQQLIDGRAQLEAGMSQLNSGITQIDNGLAQARAGYSEIENARATLASELATAEAELADAEAQLNEGETEYEEGLATFEEESETARQELADARTELEDATADLADLAMPEYLSSRREDNSEFIEYKENTDRLSVIAAVFPVFFFLIAIFISFTTMTRMVVEEREYVGIMKALGYVNRQILTKFLTYSILATAAGSFLGMLAGYTLIPMLIFDAYGSLYNLPPIHLQQYTLYTVIALLAAFGSTVGASLLAVKNSLRSNAATLLQPKAPTKGSHIWLEKIPVIWERLSFNHKITFRNVFRYKSRMFMTIFGIAGSTGLILTGFGISDAISTIPDTQFTNLNHFQAYVALNTVDNEDNIAEYNEMIQNHKDIDGALNIYQDSATIEQEGVNTQQATLFIPEDPSQIDDFVTLRHYDSDQVYEFGDAGAYITQKLARLFELEVGDEMSFEYADKELTLEVAGIVENYVGHTIYMTPQYFSEIADGDQLETNIQLLKYDTDTVDIEALGSQLINDDAVLGITYTSDLYHSFSDTLNSLDLITQILIISAAALAFIVLYNLTNINVSERERELSTIKVLGFHDQETTMYIYRENIILTIIGIFFGLIFGSVLVRFIMATMEVDMLVFGREIYLSSYLYSTALTFLFSLIVMIVIHFQLKRINMVEALKMND